VPEEEAGRITPACPSFGATPSMGLQQPAGSHLLCLRLSILAVAFKEGTSQS
jgi:hypothetical protein